MSGRSAMQASRFAIFGVFFFEAAVFGQWIPRIPDIKSGLSLSDGELGLALLSLPMGTLFGFALAGRLLQKLGLRMGCRIFLPLWALLFILPALAQTLIQLMLALAVSGIAIGMIEVAMNTEAARIETAAGKRLMSRCHGFWSIGTMAGALLGGLVAQFGVSVMWHFLLVLPPLAVGGYFMASALPPLSAAAVPTDTPAGTHIHTETNGGSEPVDSGLEKSGNDESASAEKKVGLVTLPDASILLLCCMPLGIMMVEGSFIDWSAVFMSDIMNASPLLIAVTYSFFSVVMAVTRLSGDAIVERMGEYRVVRWSGLASSIGIGLFAMAPNPLWAFIAAAIAGAGVAIVFPLTVSAAASRPGRTAAENVAALNMISFSAFLVAPPLIGFLSELVGLRYALLMLAPVAFTTFLLASEVSADKVID